MTSVSKSSAELPSRKSQNNNANNETEVPKERYKNFQKKDNKLFMNFITIYNNGISKNNKFVRQRSCTQCVKLTI